MSRKIATLNIEHGRHLPELLRFVKDEQPDVLCLQEVFEKDVELIKSKLNMSGHFSKEADIQEVGNLPVDPYGVWGLLILWQPKKVCVIPSNGHDVVEHYYKGSVDIIPPLVTPTSNNNVLQVLKISQGEELYVVGNTHFTWSAEGQASSLQRESFKRLAQYLDQYPEIILCGDLNAPRGGEIFELFTKRFEDNIPREVTTTIDSSRHYSGKQLDLVVDNIFTTNGYRAKNVRIISGVSDHCAVVGEIESINCSPRSA